MDTKAWESLSPLGKSAWYWGYINRTIECDLARLPPERSFFLRLEELSPRSDELMQFLGIKEKTNSSPTATALATTSNGFRTGPGSKKWSLMSSVVR